MLVFRPRLVWVMATAALMGCASTGSEHRTADPTATSTDMVFDILLCRPLGVASTVVGTSLFVLSYPFSAMGGNSGQALELLVKEPARFTFQRPLGDPRCPGFDNRRRLW